MKFMKKLLLVFLISPFLSWAQDDLLKDIDSVATKQKVESAFKGLKIVNIESTKLAAKGDLYFIVAHRFGSIKDDIEGFFGLDNAVTQIKFVYGLNKWLTISAGRSEQAYDFSGKYLLKSQIAFYVNITNVPKVIGQNSKPHGDPFDLLIISQALLKNIPILSTDRFFRLEKLFDTVHFFV